ncbi:hypothetical protein I552_8055 [Mycobacterium xenopi 3993]|nr:hypothetical protein I552_8055 [Mycobacterium xenopi 3993]
MTTTLAPSRARVRAYSRPSPTGSGNDDDTILHSRHELPFSV